MSDVDATAAMAAETLALAATVARR
jgi:hypothetical protein